MSNASSGFRRANIRDGDTTTTGGRVDAPGQKYTVTYGGANAAFEGDSVWCPACKTSGITKCVMPFRPDTGPDGRQKNLDGDLCLCKCPTPPRLVAKFDTPRVLFAASEVELNKNAYGWLVHAGHAQPSAIHDEQTHLTSTNADAIAGVPYFVKVSDGRTLFGRTDEIGKLPRIETDMAGEYLVYWGDEALAMMDGTAE